MTTYTFKNITLEHDREWRAWRPLLGTVCVATDQVCVNEQWVNCGEPSGRECNRSMRYRRPVPLPIEDDLLLAMFSGTSFVHPIDGDSTKLIGTARRWLRALLPGYEEQLAKALPVSVSKSQDKRYTACGVDFVPSGLSKPEELEGYKPSPVPADGWRPIDQYKPADPDRCNLEPVIVLQRGRRFLAQYEDGAWHGEYAFDGVEQTAECWQEWPGRLYGVTHFWAVPPLPPPPQEKGGEA